MSDSAGQRLTVNDADEGQPVVVIRGLSLSSESGNAAELNRPEPENLYR
jgi:F420-0:gamma-glutamyl ligase